MVLVTRQQLLLLLRDEGVAFFSKTNIVQNLLISCNTFSWTVSNAYHAPTFHDYHTNDNMQFVKNTLQNLAEHKSDFFAAQHKIPCRYIIMHSQIAKFMGSTWGPLGSCRPHVGPMNLALRVPLTPFHPSSTLKYSWTVGLYAAKHSWSFF